MKTVFDGDAAAAAGVVVVVVLVYALLMNYVLLCVRFASRGVFLLCSDKLIFFFNLFI